MKNELQVGRALNLTAPYDCTNTAAAAASAKVGSIIAVAAATVLNGVAGVFYVEGCYNVAKATGETWAVGDLLYWDDTAKKYTKTSTSNTKAGYALAAALTGDTAGSIRLVPSI